MKVIAVCFIKNLDRPVPGAYHEVSLMQKTYLIFIFLISIASFAAAVPQVQAQTLPPNTGYAFTPVPDYPARLLIPAVVLNDTIQKVGVTSIGQMAVPSGLTQNVGWYKKGTVPGQVGSAVIDAHVYAAFANLRKLKVGNDIYVQTAANKTLHFVVSNIKTYANADVPLYALFNQADAAHLNLITCAGTYIPKDATYDHRLVVYATLVNSSA
jgi:LPXTG-site transpeptidase (sortase) family protein